MQMTGQQRLWHRVQNVPKQRFPAFKSNVWDPPPSPRICWRALWGKKWRTSEENGAAWMHKIWVVCAVLVTTAKQAKLIIALSLVCEWVGISGGGHSTFALGTELQFSDLIPIRILTKTLIYRDLGKNCVVLYSFWFLIFCFEFQGNKRSLLILQKGEWTWYVHCVC